MAGFISIDVEATGLNHRKGDRAFMVIATTDTGKEYLWRFDVDPFTRKVKYVKSIVAEILRVVRKFKKWIFHNAAFDIPMLALLDKYFNPRNVFKKHEVHDTQLLGHHFDSLEVRGLKERALLHIEYPDDDEKELHKIVLTARTVAGKLGWKIASNENTPHIEKEHAHADYWLPQEAAIRLNYPPNHPWHHVCSTYGMGDVRRTAGLFIFYEEALPPDQWKVYNEHRLVILALIEMQDKGVHLLSHEIGPTRALFEKRAAYFLDILRLLCELPNFNPDSPKQLIHVLFEKYKFEPTKYGKVGPSTDKDVLADLSQLDPEEVFDPEGIDFVNTLLQYRKCLTTIRYLNNYERHAIRNRLHTSYHQVGTATVRLSASDPNTQNVGKKDDNPFGAKAAFKLRKVFGPEPGRVWYCGDYDQFQIRIFATAANDAYLLRTFEQGGDCHNAVACKMFKTESPTDLQRRAAKAINFGIIFGAGPRKIESFSGMPGSYQLFASQFPNVFKFLEAAEKQAKKTGFVHTLGGYRLRVPRRRLYTGANYIIQGTEAEIVKMAMVKVSDYLHESKSKLQLFLQVHDELVFDAPTRANVTPDLLHVQGIMVKESLRLGIPASVDFKSTTTSWADVTNYQLAG